MAQSLRNLIYLLTTLTLLLQIGMNSKSREEIGTLVQECMANGLNCLKHSTWRPCLEDCLMRELTNTFQSDATQEIGNLRFTIYVLVSLIALVACLGLLFLFLTYSKSRSLKQDTIPSTYPSLISQPTSSQLRRTWDLPSGLTSLVQCFMRLPIFKLTLILI